MRVRFSPLHKATFFIWFFGGLSCRVIGRHLTEAHCTDSVQQTSKIIRRKGPALPRTVGDGHWSRGPSILPWIYNRNANCQKRRGVACGDGEAVDSGDCRNLAIGNRNRFAFRHRPPGEYGIHGGRFPAESQKTICEEIFEKLMKGCCHCSSAFAPWKKLNTEKQFHQTGRREVE